MARNSFAVENTPTATKGQTNPTKGRLRISGPWMPASLGESIGLADPHRDQKQPQICRKLHNTAGLNAPTPG